MAESENLDAPAAGKGGWLARAKAAGKALLNGDVIENEIRRAEATFGMDAVTVSALLGSSKRQARSRAEIYRKWHYMAGDPIIYSALGLHVTMALGGHETTGDTVFIEENPNFKGIDAGQKKLVTELNSDLSEIFNKIAHQVAFNGASFGDAYARVWGSDKEGVKEICTDEMVFPPLVQPYEKGSKTVGFVVSTGAKFTTRLTIKQMVRLKMPRKLYTPQSRVVEKALKVALEEDDVEKMPVMPALVGGSFLEAAEESYDNMISALMGLVGQRILNSIDENMLGVDLEGMTIDQRKEFMGALKNMLQASKSRAEEAIAENRPVTTRLWHVMPTYGEKQLSQITQFNGSSGASSISVEDVLFHAKLLAGALGIDLSMLGFADLLTGGLGEGGFFRTSAQAAERSRIIRTALTDFFHEVIDLHTLWKYGYVLPPKDRPYRINFYGSISALENETASSRERAMNGGVLLMQGLQQMKELGLKAPVMKKILTERMEVDDSMADMISKGIEQAKKEADAQAAAEGGFGGGEGGSAFGAPAATKKDFDFPQDGLGIENDPEK